MLSPNEFREFALEYMHRAQGTRDERQRQALLEMAGRWMRAAVQVERSAIDLRAHNVPLLDDDVPLVPRGDKT
jgi:hypothetical protein